MSFFFTLLIGGLLIGLMYSLVAIGFVVTYKATGAFNFAQGEFVFFGGLFTATASQLYGITLAFSIAIGLVSMMFMGLLVEKTVIRPLIKRGEQHVALIVATLGIAFILKGVYPLVWGPTPLRIDLPVRTDYITFLGILLDPIALVGGIISIAYLISFSLLFLRGRTGIALRAVAEDKATSQLMGIDVGRFMAFAWVLTGLVAAISGIIWGHMLGVDSYLSAIGFKVFPVVILGGLTNLTGTIIAGLIIGAAENLAIGYFNPYMIAGFENFLSIVLIIIVLMVRPQGIFGKKPIEEQL